MMESLGRALQMHPEEARMRMHELRRQARAIDLAGWAPGFLRELLP
jgi:trehalose-6-phosphate synthase